MILAIDTATEFAGLALYNQDTLWAEEIWRAARNHTVELMPRLRQMLEKAKLRVSDLESIAVCIGPGSYTGVRIGVATAKGLALPHNLSVIGVNTLDITAYPHRQQALPLVAVAKAGRKRILTAGYQWQKRRWTQSQAPQLTTIAELAAQLTQPTLIAGEVNAEQAAFLRQEAKGKISVVSPLHRVRRPGVLAELGAIKLANNENDDLNSLSPIYLKEL
ncbi:MAG TPA: tRNA (adenosine(37)-N6)-threonylcarbamoyltransferase complex dimerization subunit type 1 TsaB [Chloroflexi bacterium]|nr:tRNA (adenosine(37)-N6)-threonylcarbamoyltransferase complex dimerization subunit type 1 TsaB [Chloroflexota bacterium]